METNFYKDSEAVHLFIHLILKANHRDNHFMFNGRLIEVKRGQILTGRKTLSADTGINEQKVRTRMKLFVDNGIITVAPTNKYSIVSICNYESYQGNGNEICVYQPAQQPTDNQQITTNKNDKNVNKEFSEEKVQSTCDIYEKQNKKRGHLPEYCRTRTKRGWCIHDKTECLKVFNQITKALKAAGLKDTDSQWHGAFTNRLKQLLNQGAEEMSAQAKKEKL